MSTTAAEEQMEERDRLEAARQLYKQEKASFRAQREAERHERAQRKARRDKGGPEMEELTESLQAAFGNQMQPPEIEVPRPIRPVDQPQLFVAPGQENFGGGESSNVEAWDKLLPQPAQWNRPRGPNHEQNQRLLTRLSDMGFTAASHPEIAQVVKQQTRNNLTKSDDEIIERILEALISGERESAPPMAGPSGRRR